MPSASGQRVAHHPKGARFSKDLSFFVRVAGVDAPTYVHTGIATSHAKGGVFLRDRSSADSRHSWDAVVGSRR
jgi:hypothetical protein